jgi:dTDP-4-dehydrorhamnose reductase
MRIFITGADGQLGSELRRVLHDQTLALGIWPQFNLEQPDVGRYIVEAGPDVVIHAAAYTNVDQAEREPDRAMRINADGTRRVAQAAAEVGAKLVYLSTDYVFDGRKRAPYVETDEPHPINAYGRSKLQGEREAFAHCPNTLVIRTSWLYGRTGKNFVRTVLQLATEQPVLRVVADQRGCPTHARDLADALRRVLPLDLRGILHIAGEGDCTWHEFAREIVSLMGLSAVVEPISTAESRRAARRPAYSVLSCRRLNDAGVRMPHWKVALSCFMQEVGVRCSGIRG